MAKKTTPQTNVSTETKRLSKEELLAGFYRGYDRVLATLRRLGGDVEGSFMEADWEVAEATYDSTNSFGAFRETLAKFNLKIAELAFADIAAKINDYELRPGETRPELFATIEARVVIAQKEQDARAKSKLACEILDDLKVGKMFLVLDETYGKAQEFDILTTGLETEYQALQDSTELPWVVTRKGYKLENTLYELIQESKKHAVRRQQRETARETANTMKAQKKAEHNSALERTLETQGKPVSAPAGPTAGLTEARAAAVLPRSNGSQPKKKTGKKAKVQ